MQRLPLNLALIWHMHQPDYRDSSGQMKMPWVFLHAIKDYYDMPWLLAAAGNVKATFNLTAPLIEQLLRYDEPLKNDYFLSLWIKHPSQLLPAERAWIIKLCNSPQYPTMIEPLNRFTQLYRLEHYTDEELIELEILFLLAWCGNYLRQNDPVVQELIRRKQGYVQDDKAPLLEALGAFVQTILPYYKTLWEEGVIALSTTPYHHPILPLLLNMENAALANPSTPLPKKPMPLVRDARRQIEKAIALFEETFGRKPEGFWPAEGAVDEASLKLYSEYHISWIATDESIVLKSLQAQERSVIYRPYTYEGVTIGFRDRGISDLIGFEYRHRDASEAVEDFIRAIEPIASGEEERTLYVIVDGENAWEFYPNNGYDFLSGLYRTLGALTWCRSVTMDEVQSVPAKQRLDRMEPGSWIHGTFDTWAGHRDKNRAWDLLYQAKRDTEPLRQSLSDEIREQIDEYFLACECSDWFWWYGEDHDTQFASEFDTLFRDRLVGVYRLAGLRVPSEMFESIVFTGERRAVHRTPFAPVSPVIKGEAGSFFEWFGSGSVDEIRGFSTMDRSKGPVETIRYGIDGSFLYLGLEGDFASFTDVLRVEVKIHIEETDRWYLYANDAGSPNPGAFGIGDRWIGLSLPISSCCDQDRVHLQIELFLGSDRIQSMPHSGPLVIDVHRILAPSWFV